MTALLAAGDLIARLRLGVHAEPPAVEIDWRSCFDDRPVLESGFNPETGVNASSDDAALCGDDLTKFGHDERGPWRDSYLIRPAVTP
ncbi:hypothetical protein ACWIDS_16335 [Dietzia maris]